MFLEPRFTCELADINFAIAAEAIGEEDYRIAEMQNVPDKAISHSEPTNIQTVVDRYEPCGLQRRRRIKTLKRRCRTPGSESIKKVAEPG